MIAVITAGDLQLRVVIGRVRGDDRVMLGVFVQGVMSSVVAFVHGDDMVIGIAHGVLAAVLCAAKGMRQIAGGQPGRQKGQQQYEHQGTHGRQCNEALLPAATLPLWQATIFTFSGQGRTGPVVLPEPCVSAQALLDSR